MAFTCIVKSDKKRSKNFYHYVIANVLALLNFDMCFATLNKYAPIFVQLL